MPRPRQVAASTYSLPFSTKAAPRTARANNAHCTSTSADHDLADALPDQRQHHQRDEDGRKAEHQIDKAHDQRIDAAAEIRGDEAERRPDSERHDAADDPTARLVRRP